MPEKGFSFGSVISLCGGAEYDDKLPKTAEIYRRRYAAWVAAHEAKQREYAARPVDDAAWEDELRRRVEVEAMLAGNGIPPASPPLKTRKPRRERAQQPGLGNGGGHRRPPQRRPPALIGKMLVLTLKPSGHVECAQQSDSERHH
jgi:hypothetical protein